MKAHRLIHSSDWHLGVSTGSVSRLEEQRRFLEWLCDTLSSDAADTLVVAGDIFDAMQPSAEAQALYYRFLAEVGHSGVAQVIVIGGNHDSPARLDAPRDLLQALSVHVVGGYTDRERMLIPLRCRDSGEVTAVCLAVPYMHEYRLGVRTTLEDPSVSRQRFSEAFGGLYTELVDRAEAAYPGVPVIATGHLTLGTAFDKDDFPQEIHRVGTIEAMSTHIIDARIAYTALGHIHRAYPVRKEAPVWYSGTPVPYSLKESQTQRVVLSVAVGDTTAVTRCPVPLSRTLVQIRGTREEVITRLKTLTWAEALPPLVHAFVETEHVEVGLANALHEALAEHPEGARPALVELKQGRPLSAIQDATHDATTHDLAQLTPRQVFGMMCVRAGKSDAAQARLMEAFDQIRQADEVALASLIPASVGTRPEAEGGG